MQISFSLSTPTALYNTVEPVCLCPVMRWISNISPLLCLLSPSLLLPSQLKQSWTSSSVFNNYMSLRSHLSPHYHYLCKMEQNNPFLQPRWQLIAKKSSLQPKVIWFSGFTFHVLSKIRKVNCDKIFSSHVTEMADLLKKKKKTDKVQLLKIIRF